MRINLKNTIAIIITVGFLLYIILNANDILAVVKQVRPEYIVAVMLFQLLILFNNGLFLRSILLTHNVRLKKMEALRISVVSSAVNYLTPVVGGIGFRGIYLKQKHNVNFSDFGGIIYGTYLLTTTISFVFGLIGVFLVDPSLNEPGAKILALIFSLAIMCLLIFSIFGNAAIKILSKSKGTNGTVMKTLSTVNSGWQKILTEKKTLAFLGFYSLASLFSAACVYFLAIKSIGLEASFGAAMIFASVGIINLLLNLTPGGIGVREGLYASFVSVTGLNLTAVVSFSLLDRTTSIILLVVGWGIWGKKTINEINFDLKKGKKRASS